MSEVQSSAPSASNPIPPSVLDFPIWEDCPFQDLVPAGIEVRKGDSALQQVLIFWWPEKQLHIDMDRASVDLEDPYSFLTPVIGNLTGAAWDKEFPDRFGELLRARTVAAATGKPLSAEHQLMLDRMKELDSMVPRP